MMFLYNRNNIIYNITRYNNFNRTICYCNKNNDIPPNPKNKNMYYFILLGGFYIGTKIGDKKIR